MYQQFISTPLGNMLAKVAMDKLFFLQFQEPGKLIKEYHHPLFDELKLQLSAYFHQEIIQFDIPLMTFGTVFQQHVWSALSIIPYGQVISYQTQAQLINKPKALRAVANANSKNPIQIIQACHRVIRQNGLIGGYHAGIERKRFLLALEGGDF